MTTSTNDKGVPYTVALVAMGKTHQEYIAECLKKSSRFQVADETWAINAMGSIIQHDRLFVMDDLPYFAKVAREENPSLVGYKDWLHKHPGPIYAQKQYEEFPGSVAYPLEDVLNTLGHVYINNTTVYALCYAIHLGVKHIKIYGLDFTGFNKNVTEAGRACFEYWLRDAMWRGIKITIAEGSTLMDQNTKRQLYGYSKQPIITREDGKFKVEMQ